MFTDATKEEIDLVMQKAWQAFHQYRKLSLQQRAGFMHAIAAALVLWSLATAWVVAHVLSGIPALPFQHGYLCHWTFWSIFSFAVAISFFWPFGASNRNVSYDRAV